GKKSNEVSGEWHSLRRRLMLHTSLLPSAVVATGSPLLLDTCYASSFWVVASRRCSSVAGDPLICINPWCRTATTVQIMKATAPSLADFKL
ncbi:hypothetical protein PIB30_079037, partial [Stylosanthes scabra]|nr:hypothetical protein [Stylosanthes scabra]